jgi:Bacterial PH domain
MAQGTYRNDEGIVVLTDRRVLFFFHGPLSQREEDFPLRSIVSVQTNTGMVTGEIRIFAAGNEADMRGIVKQDVAPLADAIRTQIASVQEPTTTAQAAGNEPPSYPRSRLGVR